METDHIQPLSKGGKNRLDNLQLLHRHCHHQKTAVDLYEVKENKERYSLSGS
jgi:RNA-directed DNA polymerase